VEGKEASPGACSTWAAGLGVDLGVHLGTEGGWGLWWGLWWGRGGRGGGQGGDVMVEFLSAAPRPNPKEQKKLVRENGPTKNFVREKYGPDTKQTKASCYLLTF
jgi:hypothetical protein